MKTKRWISLLLTLALCLGLLPTSVFATEGAEATSTSTPTTTYWTSDIIKWTFDESSGLLTISGSGAMPDGSITRADDDSIVGLLEAPWNVYCKQIVSVSVAEGITTIGARAFKSCANLKNVVLPESITSIGTDAFNGCAAMEYLYVGSNVASVRTIHLDTLKDVYYSSSNVNWAGIKGRFPSEARFHSVSKADDIAGHYEESDQCSCGKAEPLAEGTCGVNEALSWEISAGGVLTVSGSGAMDSDDRYLWYNTYRNIITGIVVEDGVTSIGDSAFKECREAKTVSIGSTVTSIGSGAFSHCYFSEITIPASVTSIGSRVFTFNKLSTFDVAEGNTAFKVVNGVLFSQDGATLIAYPGWAPATEYSIPEGVTTVYEGAFWGCNYLKKLSLSSTMTVPQTGAIGAGFGYLWSLTDYDVADENEIFKDRKGILLSKDGSTLVSYPNGRKNFVLPDGITTIGSFSIACDETINTIFIPDTITTIQYGAFSDCHNLKTLVIGEAVTTMANRSFAACYQLDSVYFKGEAPTSFDADTFKYCGSDIVFYYETAHKASWTNPETGYDATTQTWNGYPLREVLSIGTTRIGGIDCAYTIGADGVQVFLAQNGQEVAQGSVSINPSDLGSTSVTVQTDKANVTFDADALTKIKGGQATQIDLSYEEIENPASSGSLTEKQKEAAVDAEKVIVLELEDGSAQKVEFGNAAHTNAGSATVTVPYTPKDGEKTPVVYYVDENGNKTPLESTYDAQNGTITFVTSHFSVFAVMEETDLPAGHEQMYVAEDKNGSNPKTKTTMRAGSDSPQYFFIDGADGAKVYLPTDIANNSATYTYSCTDGLGSLFWDKDRNQFGWTAATGIPGTSGYLYVEVTLNGQTTKFAVEAEVTVPVVGAYTSSDATGYIVKTDGVTAVNANDVKTVYLCIDSSFDRQFVAASVSDDSDAVTVTYLNGKVLKVTLAENQTETVNVLVTCPVQSKDGKQSENWDYRVVFNGSSGSENNQGGASGDGLIEDAHTLEQDEIYTSDAINEHMGAFTLPGDSNTYYMVPSSPKSSSGMDYPHLNGDSSSYDAQTRLMFIEFWVGKGQNDYERVEGDKLKEIMDAFSTSQGTSLKMELKAFQPSLGTKYPATYNTTEVEAWRQPIKATFDTGSAGTWVYCASGTLYKGTKNETVVTAEVRSSIWFRNDITWSPASGSGDVIEQVNSYLAGTEAYNVSSKSGIIIELPAGNYYGYITVPDKLAADFVKIIGNGATGDNATILYGGVQGKNRRTHVENIHFIGGGAGNGDKTWKGFSDGCSVNNGKDNYAFYGSCGGNFSNCVFENYYCAVLTTGETKTGMNSLFENNQTAVCYDSIDWGGIGDALANNVYQSNETAIHFARFTERIGLSILSITKSCFVDNKTDVRNDLKRNIYIPGNYFAATVDGVEKTRECHYLPQANGNKDKLVHYYPQSANRQFNAWIYDMDFYKHDPVVSANLAATYKIPAEYLTKSVTVMNEDEMLAVWTFGKKEEE